MDPQDTIRDTMSGRRAAMIRDGRFARATDETVEMSGEAADRLIAQAALEAAATDMLAALQACYAQADFGTEELAKQVRDAIAKATGGAA